DEAIGFNLGMLVAVTDNLDWGITYHSQRDFTLNGNTRVSGLAGPVGFLNGSYDASLDITLPESVDTSLTYKLNQWTFSAGVTWTRWSRLDDITVHNQGVPAVPPSPALQQLRSGIKTPREELNWEDT